MCSVSFVDRAVEAEARLDADGEQVERVREIGADRLAAARMRTRGRVGDHEAGGGEERHER